MAVHRLEGKAGLVLNELEQVGVGAAIHAVDLVVHLAHLVGQPRIALHQRLQRRANHAGGKLAHGGKIHGQIDSPRA